jgi:hypothetical protein
MLGRSLKQGKEAAPSAARSAESSLGKQPLEQSASAPSRPATVGAMADTGLTERFRQSCVQALMSWCETYAKALRDINRDKIPSDAPLLIDEVYFRVAIAINTKISNFLMGREVSMIQNAIAVVASMTRSRLHEADPSLLSYLESAHDMLRRLDPTLWQRFDDVVRYVLPLRVKCLAGWDFCPEIATILDRRRRLVESRDVFPLSNEQVGFIKDLLQQEDVEQAQR